MTTLASPPASTVASTERLSRATSSMLWSAWADALGFISELANESALKARTNGRALTDTFAWTRRIGGKFGVQVELPAGCYSDDTQLRLAVSRSISGTGFDVEAFSRVELTVWPAYALGGGRASRAAAANMAKPNVTWSTNFYNGWTDSGGNGAAMRIQPHVWASDDLAGVGYLEDVLRDAVVTHGHPRALVGAVIHALSLGLAMHTGRSPRVEDWSRILELAAQAATLFNREPELAAFWRPRWEQTTKRSLVQEWNVAIEECRTLLVRVEPLVAEVAMFTDSRESQRGRAAYRAVGDILGLRASGTVGSATATVVASMVLAAAFPQDPRSASVLSASALGTDTDTIATMAAAVIGAASSEGLPDQVQDRQYLSDEAIRLTRIGMRQPASKFSYPDILRWNPPRTLLDVVGTADGRPALAGLGWLTWIAEPVANSDSEWTWAKTSFGPTIVVKHRPTLPDLLPENWPHVRDGSAVAGPPARETKSTTTAQGETHAQPSLFDDPDSTVPATPARPASSAGLNIDEVIETLVREKYSDESVGRAVAAVAQRGTLEQLLALVGYIREPLRRISDRH